MKNAQDEALRFSNILWTAAERLKTEAAIEGMWAIQDIESSLKAEHLELSQFYGYFAGVHARAAATFYELAEELLARRTDD